MEGASTELILISREKLDVPEAAQFGLAGGYLAVDKAKVCSIYLR